MEGGRIPYTAIVNPHDLKEMQAFKGTHPARTLMKAIAAQRKVLTAKYGPGIDRELWDRVSEGEVQIDLKLAKGDVAGALGVWRHFARMTASRPEALTSRVDAMRAVALAEAGKRLDELARLVAAGKAGEAKRELRLLARVLADTPLAERAAEVLAETEKTKK